jgi:DNA-binding transcriptional ArsR family regulator
MVDIQRQDTRVSDVLAALADPTRQAVVEVLRRGPRRAGELAAEAGVTPAALSRHLRVLRGHGLVEVDGVEADARLRVYRLRREPFVALQAWLDQVHAFWGEHLGAFAAHADRVAEDAGPEPRETDPGPRTTDPAARAADPGPPSTTPRRTDQEAA